MEIFLYSSILLCYYNKINTHKFFLIFAAILSGKYFLWLVVNLAFYKIVKIDEFTNHANH